MNATAAEQLQLLVRREGATAWADTRRLRALLADSCPGLKREIYVLVNTAEAGVLLRQLRAARWAGAFVGGDGINDDNLLAVVGSRDAQRVIATCLCAPAKGPFAAQDRAASQGD